jgi:RNA polymerase sigma factor (sigma-70 family)
MDADIGKRRFREIVLPELDAAYRLAGWIAGSSEAEDVVQDAAMRALAALATTAPANPRAWWLTIVRNTALTSAKKRRGQMAGHAEESEAEEVSDPTPDALAAMVAQDEAVRVRGALARLPPALKETLMLREIEELNYREIATLTQAPIGTVMSRLARARAMLAKWLGHDDE